MSEATPITEATPAAPAPGTPEHDAAMAAKFDKHTSEGATTEGTQEAPQVATTRPEHIPEKFWDAEKGEVRLDALVKSYSELEKAKGKPTEEPKKEPAQATQDEAQKVVEAAGLNFDSMSQEFMENGALSDETYKSLEGKGIPKNVVDSYIAGQQALAAQWENTGYEVAGGKDQYAKMVEWAAASLSQSEKVAFNTATQGNVDQMKLAVAGLKQRYEAENGKSPGLIQGGSASNSGQGYQSRAQMVAEMKDPRYAKDEAFRKSVENKLAATTAF